LDSGPKRFSQFIYKKQKENRDFVVVTNALFLVGQTDARMYVNFMEEN
jgi:hypothetical protein